MSNPLSDEELDFLDTALLDYGNDDSVLGVSELDGFLTAIVSGPHVVVPSKWLPALWGGTGKEPSWQNASQAREFLELVIRHMNDIADTLTYASQDFAAVFNVNPQSEEEILIAEEWCFGYMRGVDLGMWPPLEGHLKLSLEAIALHGSELNFDKLETMTLQEHQASVRAIEPAARALHAHWLAQRSQAPAREERAKIGRNDPCPCGSGKKFKHCCLH